MVVFVSFFFCMLTLEMGINLKRAAQLEVWSSQRTKPQTELTQTNPVLTKPVWQVRFLLCTSHGLCRFLLYVQFIPNRDTNSA